MLKPSAPEKLEPQKPQNPPHIKHQQQGKHIEHQQKIITSNTPTNPPQNPPFTIFLGTHVCFRMWSMQLKCENMANTSHLPDHWSSNPKLETPSAGTAADCLASPFLRGHEGEPRTEEGDAA